MRLLREVLAVGAVLLPLAAGAEVAGGAQGGVGYFGLQGDWKTSWVGRAQLGWRTDGGVAVLATGRLLGMGDGARAVTLTGEVRLGSEAQLLQPSLAVHAGWGSVDGCEALSANPCDGSGPALGAELGLRWLTGVRVEPHLSFEYLRVVGAGSVPNRTASAVNVLLGLSF